MITFKRLAAIAASLAMAAHAGAATVGDAGPAPAFKGIDTWLNGAPQDIAALRGKVVLVDFWTYTCINCIRTLPYVQKWHQTYKDQGLAVIGVHTPEYAFERKTENVRDAIGRFGLTFPVGQDNRYATWEAYNNRYWPAFYMIDKKGHIAYTHFGEGEYAQTEAVIRRLLAQ